jgi:SAM-dependent methyltransferase
MMNIWCPRKRGIELRRRSINLEDSGAKIISDRLKRISGGRLLDVATGDGGFIRTLRQTLRDYDSFVGIDSSKKEIAAARESPIEAAEFVEMNAENLEFEDCSFDTVCTTNSLHHLENIGLVLSEMKRTLKPEGHFIVQEMFSDSDQAEAQLSDVLSHNFDADIDSLLGVHHSRTFTRKEIRDIVGGLGLREVEVFESSRYVNCLFCDEWKKCEDPKNEDIVDYAINEIDENLERLGKHQDYINFKVEAERIKSRIRRKGAAPASILFFIGKK